MYKRYRRCAAMGGGDGESAPLQIPGAVSDGCPAFADGCPYSKNDEMLEWIKAPCKIVRRVGSMPKAP